MNRQEILSVIRKYELKPAHALGQNFLADDQVVGWIMQLGRVSQDDLVIEIGSGIGSLTRTLARDAGRVITIEIDTGLIPALREQLQGYPNCSIIQDDALKINLTKLTESWDGPVKVAANLPYYITTPLVEKIICELPLCQEIILMVQREAAERIIARPGSKLYGPMAVLAASHGQVRREKIVPAGCFIPKPRVDSCLVRINDQGELQIDDWRAFRNFLEECFAYRRKTLINSLKAAGRPAAHLALVHEALVSGNHPADSRAEMLNPHQLLAVFRQIGGR